jgi:hypothetical protein
MEKIGIYSEAPRVRGDLNIQHLSSLGAPFNSSCISIRRKIVEPYIDLLDEGKWMVDYFWFYTFAVSSSSILLENVPLTLYRRRNGESEDQLSNTENSIEQKIIIYKRYLSSHETYKSLCYGLQICGYFQWMIAKAKILLDIYSPEDFEKSKMLIIGDMLRHAPKNDVNSILSTLVLVAGYFLRMVYWPVSLIFLKALEKLKLSVI